MNIFGRKNQEEEHSFWMSYMDLMSGFLVIFIVISVLVFNEYMDIREMNLQNLVNKYEGVFVDDPNVAYKIDDERGSIVLTHKNKSLSLFAFGSDTLNPVFAEYMDKITVNLVRRTMEVWDEYKLKNIELRIEGHTDPVWGGVRNSDDGYIANLSLSSLRANAVYKYILECDALTDEQREFVKKNMISIGYSYSHRLSEGNVNDRSFDASSRRIEFRIISK